MFLFGECNRNRAGDKVRKGGGSGSCKWLGLRSCDVWYCGKRKGQCKCGTCDDRCGPDDGCPCDDCLEFLEQSGALIKTAPYEYVHKGGWNGGDGGWTGLDPRSLWYCGKKKNECKCGHCDGRCGPSNGCPCSSCFDILIRQGHVKINCSGKVAWKGTGDRSAGWVGISANQVWYCGKAQGSCGCGTCDGRCGPSNGCPCNDCLQLLVAEGKVKINGLGHPAHHGGPDDRPCRSTGVPPRQTWYCGQRKNQCRCGNCDGRCGPTNGCPCNDCLQLLIGEGTIPPLRPIPALPNPAPLPAVPAPTPAGGGGGGGVSPGGEATERLECKVCMVAEVAAALVPCGHLCACWDCAQCLTSCPVCRGRIDQRLRVYL